MILIDLHKLRHLKNNWWFSWNYPNVSFVFLTQVDESGLWKRADPAGKMRGSHRILQENTRKKLEYGSSIPTRSFRFFFRWLPGRFPQKIHQKMITIHRNMATIRQEMVGIHQGKSGDFPDVSSENSQINGHNSQEMVGIYQEKIRRFPAGILLPCSNVFPVFSCRNRSVILDLGSSTTGDVYVDRYWINKHSKCAFYSWKMFCFSFLFGRDSLDETLFTNKFLV